MRYVVSLIWTLILAQLVTYVVSSMTNIAFNYQEGIIFGVCLWVGMSLLSLAISDPNPQES